MTTHTVDGGVYRSCEAAIGGVCAGFAERFDLDPIVVRILAVFIALLTAGLGVIAYAVLWARLPRETETDAPYEVTPESAESSAFGCVDCSTGRAASRARIRPSNSIALPVRLAIAVGLMMLFLVIALSLTPMLPGTEWWQFWPLALIIAGLCLTIIPVPTEYEAAWHALGIVVTSAAVLMLPISLDILSWETVPHAVSRAWPLFAAAALLFGYGAYRKNDTLMVAAAFFVTAFCAFALTLYALPGSAETLMFHMPDGRSIRIAFMGM